MNILDLITDTFNQYKKADKTIKLNNGVLEHKGDVWYRNGKRLSLKNYKFYDNGHYKGLTADGGTPVLQLDKEGKPLKDSYIGGSPEQVRAEFWKRSPVMDHATDSIAKKYGISKDLLKHRLDKEGFTDAAIRRYNINNQVYPINYDMLHSTEYNGFGHFGLDDLAPMIQNGKVKLINETWMDQENENEKGRTVFSANGETVADNIGIMAATLKYYKDLAKSQNQGIDDDTAEVISNMMYNRGIKGANEYIKNHGYKGYNFKIK